ncbi:MAG: oxaloacetate decarboxylase [Bacteroidales bacterium]|jgi:oxaloacetate decarboxylase gamma subunit|nr:oxaloacetate decarboxylase [Bacteroidales bacterium]
MTDFQTGLLLLAIGFPAVFFMLWLVILMGRALIWFVNRVTPETTAKRGQPVIASDTVSAIVGAVHAITGGKGKVIKIEKL